MEQTRLKFHTCNPPWLSCHPSQVSLVFTPGDPRETISIFPRWASLSDDEAASPMLWPMRCCGERRPVFQPEKCEVTRNKWVIWWENVEAN